jgi:hypothetical protein
MGNGPGRVDHRLVYSCKCHLKSTIALKFTRKHLKSHDNKEITLIKGENEINAFKKNNKSKSIRDDNSIPSE